KRMNPPRQSGTIAAFRGGHCGILLWNSLIANLSGVTIVASIVTTGPVREAFCKPPTSFFHRRNMTESHLSDLRFDSLPLDDSLRRGILEAGFEYCTPIQASALPVALRGEDVAGQAQTGTGKTAAFLIAAFQRLLTRPAPRSEARRVGT